MIPIRHGLGHSAWYGKARAAKGLQIMALPDKQTVDIEALAAAVEQSPETIIVTDLKGVIIYANPAFETITGYSREEAIGQSSGILNSGVHSKKFYEDLWGTIQKGEVWSGHFTNRKKDGSIYEEEATIAPVRNKAGKIISYVSVKRDVTKEVGLELQLRQAQKLEAIGQLAAGIAHEINTPTQFVGDNTRFLKDSFNDLTDILAVYDELIEAAAGGGVSAELLAKARAAAESADLEYLKEEIPKAIDQSLEGIERVSTIVRSMKEFSHPGSSEKTPIDLNDAIGNTITVSTNEWKYVAEIQTEFDSALPAVPCLPSEFNQVILNIIVNAAHAITDVVGDAENEKGTITIRTRHDVNHACIEISDTGTGMPDEVLSRIFDPFFTTKEVGKGTGQGLAIAHSVIVEKHGGTISVESVVGEGSTFIIRLPLECETAQSKGEDPNGH